MKIGLDLDGTICQTFERIVEHMQEKGHDLSYDDLTFDEKVFAIDTNGKVAVEDLDSPWHEDAETLSKAKVYPAAKAVLQMMEGNEIHLITSRKSPLDILKRVTLQWIEANDFKIDSFNESRSHAKADFCKELGIDVMIEDSPYVAKITAEAGIPTLLFQKKYNKHLKHPNITHFSHWIEVPRLLKRLAQK